MRADTKMKIVFFTHYTFSVYVYFTHIHPPPTHTHTPTYTLLNKHPKIHMTCVSQREEIFGTNGTKVHYYTVQQDLPTALDVHVAVCVLCTWQCVFCARGSVCSVYRTCDRAAAGRRWTSDMTPRDRGEKEAKRWRED